jgi:anti-sigma factor RsiW
MNCGITGAEWTDYLDQALPVRERRKIDAHLQVCADCRRELESARQVDQRLRIECGILRQSIRLSAASEAAMQERILAMLRNRAPKGAHERLWRVRWVLALLCGSHTAVRIIQAAESQTEQADHKWLPFLRRLSFMTTEICGSYAGKLIWAVG